MHRVFLFRSSTSPPSPYIWCDYLVTKTHSSRAQEHYIVSLAAIAPLENYFLHREASVSEQVRWSDFRATHLIELPWSVSILCNYMVTSKLAHRSILGLGSAHTCTVMIFIISSRYTCATVALREWGQVSCRIIIYDGLRKTQAQSMTIISIEHLPPSKDSNPSNTVGPTLCVSDTPVSI